MTTQKPNQQLMKTTNINKTKPKAWFRLPFTPSSQETNRAYSTALRACTKQLKLNSKNKLEINMHHLRGVMKYQQAP